MSMQFLCCGLIVCTLTAGTWCSSVYAPDICGKSGQEDMLNDLGEHVQV